MESSSKINIGGAEVLVTPPASVSLRWQILEAIGKHQSMGLCAALGCAWADKPLKAKASTVGYDYVRYGAMVMDELCARYNVKAVQVVAAAAAAFNLYPTDDLIEEAEVAEAESFTEGPADSTS